MGSNTVVKRAEKLYSHIVAITTGLLSTSTRLPTLEEVKKLTISDIAIAAELADDFRSHLREYVHIDPYCLPDPFSDKDDCNYSIVLDRENPNRIIAIIVNKKENLPQLPWSTILGERLVKISVSKQDAFAFKQEIMPKETNNSYPYRRNSSIAGYLIFAFQICGQG